MEQLIYWDEQLFLYLNNLGNSTWDFFWIFMSGKFQQIPIYLVFLYFLYLSQGLKKTIMVLVIAAILILLADQTANLFKRYLVDRPRPCRTAHLTPYIRYVIDRCIGNGYFSGHSANSSAIGVFLGFMYYKKYGWMTLVVTIWFLLVGYSRIYLAQHFPGDVLTGFFVGACYACLLYWIYKRVHPLLIKENL